VDFLTVEYFFILVLWSVQFVSMTWWRMCSVCQWLKPVCHIGTWVVTLMPWYNSLCVVYWCSQLCQTRDLEVEIDSWSGCSCIIIPSRLCTHFCSVVTTTTTILSEETLPTHSHTYRDLQSYFICFLCLLWSMASSLINLHAWQSFCTTSLQVLFGPSLGLSPCVSYSINFFT